MQITSKAKLFKALGDENRLKILDFLMNSKDSKCICHVASKIKRDQSVAFRHIKILEEAELIETYKDKCYLMCKVKDKKELKKYLG